MNVDPYLVVRAGTLYLTLLGTIAVVAWRRPAPAAWRGAALAFFWNLPALLALHLLAGRAGWWTFEATGGLLLGMPVDLYLAWAWMWGAVAALAAPRLSLAAVMCLALAADLILMPAAFPVVRLGPHWIAGDILGLLTTMLPAQYLARWTACRERLAARAALQAIGCGALLLFLLPAIAIASSGSGWRNPFDRPAWQVSLIAQALALPALLGLTAVQEFVTRGGGTPVPFDPPRRLVTTGIYAYVRNPMQLSAVVMLVLLGLALDNLWVAAAGVMAHLYSVGIAGWDEDADLTRRFGSEWTAYSGAVRRWLPRRRPWIRPNRPPAQLFVADSCGVCRGVREWFERRAARALAIVPAEGHPSGSLMRITYEPADGSPPASGVAAVARALEHVHVGWALVAAALRLPGICGLAQLAVDASGGQPRRIAAERR